MNLDVLFDSYQSAESLFDGVLVHLGRLNDDNAALHLPLDHVNLSIASASQRF